MVWTLAIPALPGQSANLEVEALELHASLYFSTGFTKGLRLHTATDTVVVRTAARYQ